MNNFTVEHPSATTYFDISLMTVILGDNITVIGTSTKADGVPITITLMSPTLNETIKSITLTNGALAPRYQPENIGESIVKAAFA